MPPRGVKKGTKRARQYEHVKESEKEQGASESRAEEIAARTVNKERARSGESRTQVPHLHPRHLLGTPRRAALGDEPAQGANPRPALQRGPQAEHRRALEDDQGPAPARRRGGKELRIGCSGWSYQSWRGGLYPEGLPASRWLERYAEVFDTVEVNATFYRLVTRETVERWVEQTPEGFLFAVKASRYLTHMRRLRDISRGSRTILGAAGAASRSGAAGASALATAREPAPGR